MAKFELKFLDIEKENTSINTCVFNDNEIEIGITETGKVRAYIYLDKSTAIKFAKTLRTEINKINIEEGGDNNG